MRKINTEYTLIDLHQFQDFNALISIPGDFQKGKTHKSEGVHIILEKKVFEIKAKFGGCDSNMGMKCKESNLNIYSHDTMGLRSNFLEKFITVRG